MLHYLLPSLKYCSTRLWRFSSLTFNVALNSFVTLISSFFNCFLSDSYKTVTSSKTLSQISYISSTLTSHVIQGPDSNLFFNMADNYRINAHQLSVSPFAKLFNLPKPLTIQQNIHNRNSHLDTTQISTAFTSTVNPSTSSILNPSTYKFMPSALAPNASDLSGFGTQYMGHQPGCHCCKCNGRGCKSWILS